MNPLLTVLGRSGRHAVALALADEPDRSWNLRRLAQRAGVHPVVAGRAVRELAALGAVEALRPGRDAVVQWRPEAPAARFLEGLQVPDLRRAAASAFAQAYAAPHPVRWSAPGDEPGDPFTPTRLAVVAAQEAALDAVGPALDAVRAAGLPAPDVTVLGPEQAAEDDPVARAVRHGVPA